MAFKYSGNKSKLLEKLRFIPKFNRIAEIYLGSGRFCLEKQSDKILGIDSNKDIITLWSWLKTITKDDLIRLEKIRLDAGKVDVRSLNLSPGEELYFRVNCAGIYTGQFSGYMLYPQHKLPIELTTKYLDRVKIIELIHGNANSYSEKDGDICFIDPPYIDTVGNYGKKSKEFDYKPQETIDLIAKLNCPVIFTYGSNAKEIFPMYNWSCIAEIKVPNIRAGGTKIRTEWVSYINWRN